MSTRPPMFRYAGLATATLVAALAMPAPCDAQTRTGTAIGQFLMIEPDARMTAMGNAGVALDGALEGAYFNPAAAGRITRLEVQLAHVEWFAGIRFDQVAAAVPLGEWGTAFGTIASLGSGDIEVRTVNDPLGTGERYTVSNIAIGAGVARPLGERFSLGLQIRYFQETVWHTSAGAVTFDVGSVYRLRPDGLHIGSSVTNFGTNGRYSGRDLRITYDNDPTQAGDNDALPGQRYLQEYPVPILFRVGVGYPWRPAPDWRLWASAEAHHPNANPESVNGGVEATWRNLLSLRAGYQGLFLEESEEGLALGTGIQGRLESFGYRIDYAWADHGRLGDVHRVTVALRY